MYRIRLLKEGQVVETLEAADTSDVGEIAHQATELEARHGPMIGRSSTASVHG
jgi:hypothetical protein